MTLSTMVGPVVPVGDVSRIMLLPKMMSGGVIDLSTIENVAEWRRRTKVDASRFVFEKKREGFLYIVAGYVHDPVLAQKIKADIDTGMGVTTFVKKYDKVGADVLGSMLVALKNAGYVTQKWMEEARQVLGLELLEKTTKTGGGKWKTDKPAAVGVWKMAAGNPVMFRDDNERPVGWPKSWGWDPKKSKGEKSGGGLGTDDAGKNPGDEGFDWANKKMKALLAKAEMVLKKAKEKKNYDAVDKIEALIASIKGEDAGGFKGAASDLA